MCTPVLALTTLGLGIQVYGQVQQGRVAKKAADYNARVAENEAVELKNKAITVESEERQKAMELRSRQRAQLAARGVNVDVGTALQVQEDTELLGEMNAMRIRQNAASRIESLGQEAELTRFQGESAMRQGMLGAFATTASGAGQVAQKWYDYNQSLKTG